MTQVLRWGVLGAAKFAREHMAPAIHAAKGNTLAAIATSDARKAAPFQDFAPGVEVFTDYDALLASDKVDAVYIPLPNAMHVEWMHKAIAAGKHVLCEKPVAMTAADIDGLIEARDRAGVLAAEAFMILHHPQWQRARALLAEGAIGPVTHADVFFCFSNADPGNIRNRPETGGGALRDIGVYAFGSLRYAMGAEPLALDAKVDWQGGIDAAAHVQGEMRGAGDAFSFHATVSMRLTNRQEVVFMGPQGYLKLTAPFNAGVFGEARLEFKAPSGDVRVETWPTARQYELQVEAFAAAVRTKSAYPVPLEFSRGTQVMIDEALRAGGPAPD